ncbi:MAG: trypsin-like peptidase domain-containing protein [Rhodobacteraceae bacterium]|nr:trypsin-like peptidase domain-containing protein [Paracoccaceae bacterium]
MKLNNLIITIFSIFLLFLSPIAVSDDSGSVSQIIDSTNVHYSRHYERSRGATVKITTPSGGHGTGTYIRHNGVYGILTAAHVVTQGQIFLIDGAGQQNLGALVWIDNEADLAFLVTNEIAGLNSLRIAASPQIKAGDVIVYSGYPSSHEMLTFACTIANANYSGKLMIQGYAWFGASGSGFINSRGKVVGVLSAVSVENFFGHPQVLETLVYGAPLTSQHIEQIEAVTTKLKENR